MTVTANTLTAASSAAPVTRLERLAAREIALEHAALARQLAGLQRRVTEQVRAHDQRVQALESDVVRLRAQLIVVRTGQYWGLSTTGVARPLAQRAHRATAEALAMAEASGVICQTGCVGHAHPWLEADGQCRRTGVACAHVSALRNTAA